MSHAFFVRGLCRALFILEEKEMKFSRKFVAILLVLTMLSGICLTSCSSNSDSDRISDETEITEDRNSDKDKDNSVSNNDNNNNLNNSNNNSQDYDNIQDNQSTPEKNAGFDNYILSYVTDIQAFSEGKAFIKLKDSNAYSCIDTKGNVLFNVDCENSNLLNCVAGFHNGIAAFNAFLCDTNGNKIHPELVGGTSFRLGYSIMADAFKDGYIAVSKTTTNFMSSVTELAIVNSKMEIIVDYSAELFDLYVKYIDGLSSYPTKYFKGYLIQKNDGYTALNLNTGKETGKYSSFKELVEGEDIAIKHKSDIWAPTEKGYCYDDLTGYSEGELVLDLSQYENAIFGDFVNGLACVVFRVSTADFFTIIDETGSFKFEPVELKGTLDMSYAFNMVIQRIDNDHTEKAEDYGKFVVLTKDGEHILTTFAPTGKIAEKEIEGLGCYRLDSILTVGDNLIFGVMKQKKDCSIFCFDLDLNKQ